MANPMSEILHTLGNIKAWTTRLLSAWLEQAKMREHLFAMGVATVIGMLCGLGAVIFRWMIILFQRFFWHASYITVDILRDQPAWRIVGVPGIGGLVVGVIVYYFAAEARGHGVPEVMAAVALRNGVIRARVAIAKILASAITIASGGSAGREGPIIQIGSTIGSVLGQFLKVSRNRLRTYVACGAAGGIAATFNAPIAGALFSIEIILGEFGVAQFSPIVISSVIATVVSRRFLGSDAIFTVPQYELVSGLELIPYTLLGALCGLVSVLFIFALDRAEEFFGKKRAYPAFLNPLFGGLLLGIIGLVVPHVYGDGHAVIDAALLSHMTWWLLGVLLLAKIVATSLTLGSGGSGGVFAPSLFMGAMAGGMLGHIVAPIMGSYAGPAGGYALVGMGGVVAGATRAPITAILIIFEMTNNYTIILPLMLVCVISLLISSRFSRESIYTIKLIRRGIDLFRGRSLDLLKDFTVAVCVRTDYEAIAAGTALKDVMPRILRSEQTQFYATDSDGRLRGIITLGNARRILLGRGGLEHVLLVEDIAHADVPFCTSDESLSNALRKFAQSRLPELPVVSNPQDCKLCGVIHYSEVARIYQDEIIKVDTAGGFARAASMHAMEMIEVSKGIFLAEWDPPSSLWGKTLRDSALPARHGLHVVMVKKKTTTDTDALPVMAGPDYVIAENDALIVYGRKKDIEKARKL